MALSTKILEKNIKYENKTDRRFEFSALNFMNKNFFFSKCVVKCNYK